MHDVHLRLGAIAEVRVANVRVPSERVPLLGEVVEPPLLLLFVVRVRIVGYDGDEFYLLAVLRGALDVLGPEGDLLARRSVAIVVARATGALVGRLHGRVLRLILPLARVGALRCVGVIVLAVAAVGRGERPAPSRVERPGARAQVPGAAQPGSRAREQPGQRAHRRRRSPSMPPALKIGRDARPRCACRRADAIRIRARPAVDEGRDAVDRRFYTECDSRLLEWSCRVRWSKPRRE